jgi:hypothetical protein
MTNKIKDFDCVEMQDRAALRIYEETKDMTKEQELAYWQRKNEEAHKRYPRMREAAHAKSAAE